MTHPVEAAVAQALSNYPNGRFAIGFSGGGDSTALLYGLRKHAANIRVFIVDHALRTGSRDEALAARSRVQKWGYETDILTWQSMPLKAGIQNKARHARYRLIGAKMRSEGLTHLLTGHTADDQAETCLMRYERGTNWRGAAGMAASVYAPVWPELANITVLRPLLACSREQLRDYNHMHNLIWSEDPSNENREFTRIRARDYLTERPDIANLLCEAAADLQVGLKQERSYLQAWVKDHVRFESLYGYILLDTVPPREVLLHLLRAVSGQGGIIERTALKTLQSRMKKPDFKAATLGGAHIVKTEGLYLIARDPVIAKGRKGQQVPLGPQSLIQGHQIWDGRFSIYYSGQAPLIIQPEWGYLDPQGKPSDMAKEAPIWVRPTVPIVTDRYGNTISIGLVSDGKAKKMTIEWLGAERLLQSLR